MNDVANIEEVQAVGLQEPRPDLAAAASVRKAFLPALVIKNVAAGYGVQIGRKLIPLASIPYLARVLGPDGWGQVAFVSALAELIVILVEFGFTLSATRSIAHCRDNAHERGRITIGVLCAQSMLAAAGVAAALVASRFIPLLREHPALLAAGLMYAVAQGLVPIWFFQGTERIRLGAVIEVCAKTAGLIALFIFVKKPEHAWRALAIQAVTPTASVIIGLRLACANISWRPEWSMIRAVLVEGWQMFIFRSAESIYGVANAFVLGLFAPAAVVGYFASAEKVSKATAGLSNPIRESFYPRINHLIHQDRVEARRLARIGVSAMVGVGLLFSVVLFLFTQQIVSTLMGNNFQPAVNVLKILSPLPLALSITYSCGQLCLLPLRQDRTVLRVVICAAVINLVCSFSLGPRWGEIGMAVTVLISECVVAASLAWNVLRLRDSQQGFVNEQVSEVLISR